VGEQTAECQGDKNSNARTKGVHNIKLTTGSHPRSGLETWPVPLKRGGKELPANQTPRLSEFVLPLFKTAPEAPPWLMIRAAAFGNIIVDECDVHEYDMRVC
jgi:hypothetical protein